LGGISLSKFEDLDSMNTLAAENGPSNRVVYPLIGKGERFPISDKEFVEVSTSIPESDTDEFRSILEGIAFAERLSYEILNESGGPKISLVNTVGGGSKSFLWSRIRATVLNMNVITRPTAGSDLGAAMIALASWMKGDLGKNIERMPLQNGTVVEPNPYEKDKLEINYQKFLKLIHRSHKDL
jgi:xylulokinase